MIPSTMHQPPNLERRQGRWHSQMIPPLQYRGKEESIGGNWFTTILCQSSRQHAIVCPEHHCKEAGDTRCELANKWAKQVLEYAAKHQNATILYRASDMRPKIHSDSSYLNDDDAKSNYGGSFSWNRNKTLTNRCSSMAIS